MTHSIQNLKHNVLFGGIGLTTLIVVLTGNVTGMGLNGVGWTIHEIAWLVVALATFTLAAHLAVNPTRPHAQITTLLIQRLPRPRALLITVGIAMLIGTLTDIFLI